MTTQHVNPSILQNIDTEVSRLISQRYELAPLDALREFLASETHHMLEDNTLRMWHFSPIALLDMWETEQATGDPRNSIYLRGDEIG